MRLLLGLSVISRSASGTAEVMTDSMLLLLLGQNYIYICVYIYKDKVECGVWSFITHLNCIT